MASRSSVSSPTCLSVSCSSVHVKNIDVGPQCNSTFSCKVPNSFYTWHCRLGHANEMAVRTILHKCNIPYINKTAKDFCLACSFGKSHRLPSQPSVTVYDKTIWITFSGSLGTSPCAVHSWSLILSVHCWCLFQIYMVVSTWTKVRNSCYFQTVSRIDQSSVSNYNIIGPNGLGGGFRPFTNYLKDLGIMHRVICPHTLIRTSI